VEDIEYGTFILCWRRVPLQFICLYTNSTHALKIKFEDVNVQNKKRERVSPMTELSWKRRA